MILAHASIKSVDMVNKKIAKQKMCMLIFFKKMSSLPYLPVYYR